MKIVNDVANYGRRANLMTAHSYRMVDNVGGNAKRDLSLSKTTSFAERSSAVDPG